MVNFTTELWSEPSYPQHERLAQVPGFNDLPPMSANVTPQSRIPVGKCNEQVSEKLGDVDLCVNGAITLPPDRAQSMLS